MTLNPVTIAALFCFALTSQVWAQTPDVRMPVTYDNAMFIVVSDQGVVALKFLKPFEMGNENRNGVTGVSYQWRFLANKGSTDEESGSGRVFVKLNDGQVEDRKNEIVCGPIKLRWHYADLHKGFVDYSADQLHIFSLAASLFEPNPIPDGTVNTPIDLQLFKKTVNESEPADKRVACPAIYDKCTLIVRKAEGTARFSFGAAYEKEVSATEKRYGVPYHSVFVSADGQTKIETDDEVYERYTNGAYDRGKLEIVSGPIQLEWSRGGNDQGWVYFVFGNTKVWNVENSSVDILLKSLEQKIVDAKQ